MVWVRSIVAVLLLVGIVFGATQYAGFINDQATTFFHQSSGSVKGAKTDKAHEITDKFGSDLEDQVEEVKKQAMNVKIGEVISTFSRIQKIPQDIKSFGVYVKDQAEDMLKSKVGNK